jgi:hypothetical protein
VRRRVLALAIACPLALAAAPARADVTSWLAIGGGATSQLAQNAANRDYAGALTYSFGVGTTPLAPLVLGVIYRGTTMFGLGTDLSAGLRLATGGFARGNWGVALDAGVVWRTWGGGTYGDSPLQGILTFGSPWGLQIAAGTQLWTLDNGVSAQGFFAALEVDLLRLTVMRQGATEKWWPNPNHEGSHSKQVSLLSF